MVILDGKKLSQKIFDDLKEMLGDDRARLELAIINVGANPASRKFIAEKQKIAGALGIDVKIYNFKDDVSERVLGKKIFNLARDGDVKGIVVQLPLPRHIDTERILNLIPQEKDPDILSSASWEKFSVGASEIIPPIVGAIRAFFSEYGIDYKHAYTVVVGQGKLVGRPVSLWLKNEGATFAVIDENTKNAEEIIKSGDIVISGIGKPKMIGPDMIKEGAVVIDAGTSESQGKLVGDVDFNLVSEKTSYITPVPGGVGPVTVAMLFSNLIFLAKNMPGSSLRQKMFATK